MSLIKSRCNIRCCYKFYNNLLRINNYSRCYATNTFPDKENRNGKINRNGNENGNGNGKGNEKLDSNKKIEIDDKILKLIGSYPKHPNATPYDILNINKNDKLNSKQLKKIFFNLAKIYHPDSNFAVGYPLSCDQFFNDNENLLNNKIKDERFKTILSAYNLLKNPITKSNYDKYNIGWMDNTNLRTNPNMYNPSSPEYWNQNYHNKTNFTSYETGTWEDRYRYGHETAYGFSNDKTWSSSKTGSFKEEVLKNKKTIGLSILFTFTVYSLLQFSHIYFYDDLIGEDYQENFSPSMHDKSEDDLFHAYTNYGLGNSKQDRINRFLWWRKFSMAFSLAEVKEVLDHFYKRGVIDASIEEEQRLKQFERSNVR